MTELWHTKLGGQLAATLPTVGVNGTVQSIAPKTFNIPPKPLAAALKDFAAQSEGITSDDITRMILEKIPQDR